MSLAAWVFDGTLTLTLVVLGWGAVAAPDPFTGIVRYITFGLMAALAWARLGAPDLALAEAAIGAGLTGALLLSTLGRMGLRQASRRAGEALGAAPRAPTPLPGMTQAWTGLVLGLSLAIAAVIGGVARTLHGRNGPGLGPLVDSLREASGIDSPVAVVLLDLRGYDTLLETAVLFTAVLAVWCLGVIRFRRPPWPVDPVLASLARVVTALLVLVAAYLLQLGLHGPGGGFQAGAVLAAAGVLWTLADRRALRLGESRLARIGLTLGLGAFLVAAVIPMLAGRPFLTYAAGSAPAWAWVLETFIAVSVGLTLTALFMGGLSEIAEDEAEERAP